MAEMDKIGYLVLGGLEGFEAALSAEGLEEEVVKQYASRARSIVEQLESPDEAGLQKFLGETLKGKMDNYRRFNYFVLKKLFAFAKVPWPNGVKIPKLHQASVHRPRYSLEQVTTLIQNSPRLNPRDCYYFVLAIIYGWRRKELALSRPEHLDRARKRILVMTRKGGQPRWHLVPDSIFPTLAGYNFVDPPPITDPKKMSALFHEICKTCGLETKKRDGWHNIRRALVRQLKRPPHKNSKDDIHTFLRWEEDRKDMVNLYGGELEPEDFEGVDAKILANHPFLLVWANVLRGGNQNGIS